MYHLTSKGRGIGSFTPTLQCEYQSRYHVSIPTKKSGRAIIMQKLKIVKAGLTGYSSAITVFITVTDNGIFEVLDFGK